ncbi:MAG: DUF134 domain-containing protein [Bacteroidales bacterium]|jgi:predicted DNA-binding protein (UPF0251 family)|nr:DUF134 domain-containing protein [Bacteroidales bacterium]MDD3105559.1 DUF134 domain-containing protein [Bacteroidales bacterium]MDD3550161.1 DUF134 domain-containing protein [Bacteroidales bacterium]MDD4065308.1 DUF134 domain-containing protein [Bacteroidales bacterium]MDD4500383.1 DUF134 domain-containing protein [Bacteroidales bacterium]
MARPKKLRKITNPPKIKGFSPIRPFPGNGSSPVLLDYDEFEALRLSDYELKSQSESAVEMGISRPTFARIYESARRKVAKSFVEGAPILFQGGPVYFSSEWYSCKDCGCWFNHLNKEDPMIVCPLCRSANTEQSEAIDETNK